MVDPLVGRLPDNNSDPECQICGNEMNKSKSCKQSKSFNNDGGVDEQEVHLEEGEESLQENKLRRGVNMVGGREVLPEVSGERSRYC